MLLAASLTGAGVECGDCEMPGTLRVVYSILLCKKRGVYVESPFFF